MQMNTSLTDWLAYLESLHPKGQAGIRLGLERVARVSQTLMQQKKCPVIVVGGTNGKGSTCAMLEAIYKAAGYRVGLYTSPHILHYSERIRIDASPVEAAPLCRAFEKVDAAMKAAFAASDNVLTYFEFSTLAAWEVFAEAALGVLILEVGLGGRLDAVNIYDADCAVITGIALDHTDWLGPTREAIGFEKAGILRTGKPAFYADYEPPKSVLDHAARISADLRLIGRDFDEKPNPPNHANQVTWDFRLSGKSDENLVSLPLPGLQGAFQRQNAAAALAVVTELAHRLPVSETMIRLALAAVRLPGRFHRLQQNLILDVAHNPQSMAGLATNLKALEKTGKTFAVIGMLADKDIAGALAHLVDCVDAWFFADLRVPRGALAEELLEKLNTISSQQTSPTQTSICFISPEDAFKEAAKQAGENDKIVVTGSFHTVAAILLHISPSDSLPIK